MKRKILSSRVKQVAKRTSPVRIVKNRTTAMRLAKFADKVGMVYFGYVSQRNDDYKLIRGHTLSRWHKDNHYAVGTVKGYDVAFVVRSSSASRLGGHRRKTLIVMLDLRINDDLPHIYIGHMNREEAFHEAIHQLHNTHVERYAQYPTAFTEQYSIYTSPGKAHEVSALMGPHIADVIGTHFEGASIEIDKGYLYLYKESEHPSEVLLEKLLSNGLWLGEVIDAMHLNHNSVKD